MTYPDEPKASGHTLEALVDLAKRTLSSSVGARTLRTYRSQWNRLLLAFGPETEVAAIDTACLQRFVDERISQVAPMTLRHACQAVIRLREIGVQAGWELGPTPGKPVIPEDQSHPTPEEIGQMLASVEDPEQRDLVLAAWALIATSTDLGRIGRADWVDGTLTLRDANGRGRAFPIVPELASLLRRRATEAEGEMFPQPDVDRAGRSIRRRFGARFGLARLPGAMEHALERAGLSDSVVHSLRRGPGFNGTTPPAIDDQIRQVLSRVLTRAGLILATPANESPVVRPAANSVVNTFPVKPQAVSAPSSRAGDVGDLVEELE